MCPCDPQTGAESQGLGSSGVQEETVKALFCGTQMEEEQRERDRDVLAIGKFGTIPERPVQSRPLQASPGRAV